MASSVDIVKGLYEAFGNGDVPAVLGGMADDVEWHEPEGLPYSGVHRGPSAVAEKVFGPLTQEIPDFALAPQQFMSSGDSVAAVVRLTGTGKATGKKLALDVVHVWDLRDGKVARFRQFADTVTFGEVFPADVSVTA
jgi:ketosteroid isomerase-like protein